MWNFWCVALCLDLLLRPLRGERRGGRSLNSSLDANLCRSDHFLLISRLPIGTRSTKMDLHSVLGMDWGFDAFDLRGAGCSLSVC